LHVVPDRFVRIRYYGLLAQSQRARTLSLCRQLLPESPRTSSSEPVPSEDPARVECPITCPSCGSGNLTRLRNLPPPDTS
jgi:hypothetical protein